MAAFTWIFVRVFSTKNGISSIRRPRRGPVLSSSVSQPQYLVANAWLCVMRVVAAGSISELSYLARHMHLAFMVIVTVTDCLFRPQRASDIQVACPSSFHAYAHFNKCVLQENATTKTRRMGWFGCIRTRLPCNLYSLLNQCTCSLCWIWLSQDLSFLCGLSFEVVHTTMREKAFIILFHGME